MLAPLRHAQRMEKFVKEVSPLRMKNAVLHNTLQKLKKRVKDMESMSHLEQLKAWNADQVKPRAPLCRCLGYICTEQWSTCADSVSFSYMC